MPIIETTIVVDVPLHRVFDEWTRFLPFPPAMRGEEEWGARVTELTPDRMIAWSSSEPRNDATVRFRPVVGDRTRIDLRLEMAPGDPAGPVGDVHITLRNARGDLERFKEVVEREHGAEDRPTITLITGSTEAVAMTDSSIPGEEIDLTEGPGALGEVTASTGGQIDLARVVGNIPVVLVFLSRLDDAASAAVLRSLGDRLSDFGHDRVQVLAVGPVDGAAARSAGDAIPGNVRIVADADGTLASLVGAGYGHDHPTTVLIGADGRVAARWVDTPSGTFAEDLLARITQLSSE